MNTEQKGCCKEPASKPDDTVSGESCCQEETPVAVGVAPLAVPKRAKRCACSEDASANESERG